MAKEKKQIKSKNSQSQGRSNPFPKMEEEVLDFWDQAKIFEKSVEKEAPKGDYVFYDGPPFGTGEPHYGHILSSVTKDVVPRYWTMKGFRVKRRWGWDCHGLPIENIIEEDMGISGKKEIEKIGIAKFNEACRSQVLRYADIWGKMVRRIGRWVEFNNSYKTMDTGYMESVWWAFKKLWNKDLIYKGRKVLLYCPRCETPISNFEVAMDNSYKDITETSVTVKFKVKNPTNLQINYKFTNKDNIYILAWTTTPWTLPGNVALAVGKDIDYVIVKVTENKIKELGDEETPPSMTGTKIEYFIVAKEKVELLFGGEIYEVVKKIKGKDLIGLEYEPLFDVPALKNSGKENIYKVHAADFVTTEDGTGVVHTAVVYGEDDYNLGLKLDLPVIPALDEKGYFNDTVPQFKGIYFTEANKLIIEDLKKKKLLFKIENTQHSYPYCHRCDTQLFYNAIPAWFLSIAKIRKDLIAQNENINWYPEHLKHGRFKLGLEQAPDWNISRNRYFATPIPIWECDKCQEREVMGNIKELEERSGKKGIKDIHSHFIDNLTWKCKCGGETKRIKEVFDCWVESGSMSFAQHHYPFENKEKFESTFPAQYISEYISQTRAWFYVMHVMSVALFGKNSFENCVTNGVILNEKGKKMSKSKKNYPDPWKVINEFGVDALRFYMMSSSLMHAENLFFNERELRDVFRKNIMILWNVYKFYSMFAGKFKVESLKLKVKSDNMLDKWILARLNQLIEVATDGMDNYDLPKSTRPITEFIDDLSTWYIRRSRDRFKGEDELDKQAAIKTTGYVLQELAKVMAPFMPFMAEQLWQKVTGNDFKDKNKSVHLEEWPLCKYKEKDIKKYHDKSSEKEKKEILMFAKDVNLIDTMEITRRLVEEGLAKRDELRIKIRQPLSSITVNSLDDLYKFGCNQAGDDDGSKKYFEQFKKIILDELNIKKIISVKDKNSGNMIEVIDIDSELTPELKQEGLKRELVRFINNMRKNANLTIQDRINLYWQSQSKEIKDAISNFQKDILKDILADDILEGVDDNIDEKKEVKVNGADIILGIKKI